MWAEHPFPLLSNLTTCLNRFEDDQKSVSATAKAALPLTCPYLLATTNSHNLTKHRRIISSASSWLTWHLVSNIYFRGYQQTAPCSDLGNEGMEHGHTFIAEHIVFLCEYKNTMCQKTKDPHSRVDYKLFCSKSSHKRASKHLWIEHYLFSCQHILLMSQAMKCWLKYWAAQLQSTKKRICCLWCVHCFVYFWIADLLDTFSQFFRWCEHREMLIVFTY